MEQDITILPHVLLFHFLLLCHSLICSTMLGIGILRRVRHSLGLLTGKPVGFLPDNFPGYCVDLVGIRTLVRVEL